MIRSPSWHWPILHFLMFCSVGFFLYQALKIMWMLYVLNILLEVIAQR